MFGSLRHEQCTYNICLLYLFFVDIRIVCLFWVILKAKLFTMKYSKQSQSRWMSSSLLSVVLSRKKNVRKNKIQSFTHTTSPPIWIISSSNIYVYKHFYRIKEFIWTIFRCLFTLKWFCSDSKIQKIFDLLQWGHQFGLSRRCTWFVNKMGTVMNCTDFSSSRLAVYICIKKVVIK